MPLLFFIFALRIVIGVFDLDGILSRHATEAYLVLDLLVLGAAYVLLREFRLDQILKSIARWIRSGELYNSKHFNLSLVSDVLRAFALGFAIFWLSKWTSPAFDSTIFSTQIREFAFLDSFIFTGIIVGLLDPDFSFQFVDRFELTSARVTLVQFGLMALIGALLLLLPISVVDGKKLDVIDGLFLSVSALSVTGLSPVDVSQILTKFGFGVLLALIQLGGLGVIVLTIGIGAAIKRRLTLEQIQLSQSAFENCFVGDSKKFLSQVVTLTVLIEALGAIWLYFTLPHDLPDRFFVALFHSVSAFCNAGFSTFSANMAAVPFTGVSLFGLCLLIIVGGIGFPVLIELLSALRKRSLKWHLLSPQTKLILNTTAVLLVSGFLVFALFQWTRPAVELSFSETLKQAAFYSVSARTAGFNLISLDQFSTSIQFLIILLMFIGASPSSTGGGVKTSTLGVLWATVRSSLLQTEYAHLFSRTIATSVIQKSISVVSLYVLTAGAALLILASTESVPFTSLMFEVFSALSTVGLSVGATTELTSFGKVIVIFLMIFGRVGLILIVNAGVGRIEKMKFQYPKENFYVG